MGYEELMSKPGATLAVQMPDEQCKDLYIYCPATIDGT